jgi:hypothetical protein
MIALCNGTSTKAGPIGGALPNETLEGFFGAILIVHAKRSAVRIAEIELRSVGDSRLMYCS